MSLIIICLFVNKNIKPSWNFFEVNRFINFFITNKIFLVIF